MTEEAVLENAVAWIEHALGFEPNTLKVGKIGRAFPERRYWFTEGDVLCHAGNFREPYWFADNEVSVRQIWDIDVAVDDEVVYAKADTSKGPRAKSWYRLKDVLALHAATN